jgi:NAD(P)-dependent dehydrogenase (short-subunit alcohol dehydrogenase family)
MSTPVVLITGALTGIGRAAALAFAQEGNRFVVSGRHDDAGEALVYELRGFGGEAEFIRADMRREDDVRSLVDQTVARFGRLDAAVNAAGTEGKPGPVTDQTADSYAATFDTNVLGTLLSMKHELRVMLAQRSGSIVNVSSTYGHAGTPNASVYAASKHAVEGLTTSAALEVAGSGVRVNAVAPGPTETLIASRAMPKERLAWSRPCRSAASDSPTRSPTPFCFFAPTRRRLSAAMCFRSMAGSRRGKLRIRNPDTTR